MASRRSPRRSRRRRNWRAASRKSALSEAYSRLTIDRAEVEGAHQTAAEALAELPASAETETKLAAVRAEIDGQRRLAVQVRAEAQALAREAELADRRVQAIIAEIGRA